MTYTRRNSSIIAAVVVALVLASVGSSFLANRGSGSATRMVAFPAGLQESTVLAALAQVDIDDVIGASSALVPLSNFSRIMAVTFLDASKRALPGDPRRTPFLDELTLRFSAPGPDDTHWTVIYLPGPSRTRDEATARVLTGLSPDWAWDGTEYTGGSYWLLLPALVWAVWLVAGNSRRDRFRRMLWVASFLPLLPSLKPGGTLLFILLTAACTIATRYMLSGATSRLPFILLPYAITSIALLAYAPDFLPYMAASIMLAATGAWFRLRLERLASNRRLHAPPEFLNLTMIGVHGYARRITRVLVVPVVVLVILTVLVPTRMDSALADAPRFRIERAAAREHVAANALFEEHSAFQRAITYGRLGDFSLENTSYTPVYRYREEAGRMMRFDDAEDPPGDWSVATFKAAIKVLSDEGPGSIRPK